MSKPANPTFVDAAQICEKHGVSRSRLSEWNRDRADTGFPAAHHGTGRRGNPLQWLEQEVDAWFTQRAKDTEQARKLPVSVLEGDRDELLNTTQVAAMLGFKRRTTIVAYLRQHPGYFPEPDVVEPIASGPGKAHELHWRRGTIVDWKATRPGKGNRIGATRQAPELPEVPADGDPDELLSSTQAAALLGYKSLNSFSSALAQGNLPGLATPDAMQAGARGGPRRRWKRSTVLAARTR
ncbi:helix-turn-helix transcriptional regulator [Actinacidiphila glaucinigra]|uniref:helix-turn-helix transcriptional regulator n=1 Tax=Actinacidiphila glaucinigra TaxID=235986 RepID=UPI003D916D5D